MAENGKKIFIKTMIEQYSHWGQKFSKIALVFIQGNGVLRCMTSLNLHQENKISFQPAKFEIFKTEKISD